MNLGYEKGDVCNRNGCTGIIEEYERRGCSCHINPPCSACTEPRAFCSVCDWQEAADVISSPTEYKSLAWKVRTLNDLDKTKIDYLIKPHTHFSQICEGVYPEGTIMAEVLEKVKGSFGGRFEYFGNGRFKYIAYTD